MHDESNGVDDLRAELESLGLLPTPAEKSNDTTPAEKLNDYRDLDDRGFGSRTTIWRKVKAGRFPPPVYIGEGQPRWRESKLIKYLAECEAKTKSIESRNPEV